MGLIHRVQTPSIITTTADHLFNWARNKSLWWLGYGIACCAIEMMTTSTARYDFDRFGIIPRSSPRQSDVMIVAGPVTKKMEPVILRLYDQMAEPRWIMAMGSCAISGGAFSDSYNVLKGVDTILPVDVYIPGCPPRPEALIFGFLALREKVKKETFVGGGNGDRNLNLGLSVKLPPSDKKTDVEDHGDDSRVDEGNGIGNGVGNGNVHGIGNGAGDGNR